MAIVFLVVASNKTQEYSQYDKDRCAGCLGCKKAVDLAQWVTQVNPRLEVHAVGVSQESEVGAKALVAVPTYVYNGEPVFLGNPSPDELRAWLDKIDTED